MESIPGWEWPVEVRGSHFSRDEYLIEMRRVFVETKRDLAGNPFAQFGPQMLIGMADSALAGDTRGQAAAKCFAEQIIAPAIQPVPGERAPATDGCNYDLIGVAGWSATPTNAEHQFLEGSTRIEIRLTSAAPKITEMLEGAVELHDALDREIGRIKLDEDIRIVPGKNWVQSGSFMPSDLDRLTRLRPEHVKARVCVRSVLYDDGTVERFDQ